MPKWNLGYETKEDSRPGRGDSTHRRIGIRRTAPTRQVQTRGRPGAAWSCSTLGRPRRTFARSCGSDMYCSTNSVFSARPSSRWLAA